MMPIGPPPSDEKTGDLYYVSLLDAQKSNIVVECVREGWLEVEAPRGMADQLGERSRDYEELGSAQDAAKAAGVGRWAGEEKAPAPEAYTELILQNPNAPQPAGAKGRSF